MSVDWSLTLHVIIRLWLQYRYRYGTAISILSKACKLSVTYSEYALCACACAGLNTLRALRYAAMTSCEPGRTRAYSEDLRWRIVWQREALGKKCKDVASNLGVDSATVSRIVTRFRETGLVVKKSYPSRRAFRKLTTGVETMILHILLRRPGIYLREVVGGLNDTLGAEVALSTMCMFLKKCGFTRQKLRLSAIQRDSFLRLQFISEVALYDQDMMAFLDETGSDRRNSIRKYGYSIRRPLVSEKTTSLRQKNIGYCLHVCPWDA